MPSQVDRNPMGLDQQRYPNMLTGGNTAGQDSINRLMMGQNNLRSNVMGQDNIGLNVMGRNIYSTMSNRGKASDMSRLMGRNMVGQDRTAQMMRRNMMSRQGMTPNMMYRNIMGQDAMDVANTNQISSNTISSNMGQRVRQRMEMELVPETYTSTRLF